MTIVVVTSKDPPHEYYCNGCGQLRLNWGARTSCGNCGSHDLVIGAPGTLKRLELARAREQRQRLEEFLDS